MLKKLLIIFLILILTVPIILILTVPTISIGVSGDLNDYEPKLNEEDVSGFNSAIKIGGLILRVIRIIGIIGAVIGIAILGIKTMIGSLEEKAEYKEKILPFIIGCLIIVSSTFIVGQVYKALNARKTTNHPPPPIALPIED